MENFYVLVGVITVIHYALLRKLLKRKDKEPTFKDYIVYLSILPIILYIFYLIIIIIFLYIPIMNYLIIIYYLNLSTKEI